MENDVVQQSADMPHSDQDSKVQRSEVDESLSESRLELTRMDQSVATESYRPVYLPPGLEDPNHVTEHPTAPTTTITGHQNMYKTTDSWTTTCTLEHPEQHHFHLRTAPIAHWIWTQCQRAQMRQDFQRTSGQGHQNFPSRHHQTEKCWDPLTPLRRCQVFQMKSLMLQSSLSIATECWMLGKTSCKRIHPEPVIEKERHAGLLVGTWYYLIPDPSGALVSEVVDRKDLALDRTHIPGHHFTPTGPTDGHNNESDCAMDDNVFLARSSDEVYPKHLSPDERVAFEIADSAE